MYTPHVSTFLCLLQEVLHLCLPKLHKFLELKLSKLQFHKTIIFKYIKLSLRPPLVTQYNLFDIIICCAINVYWWLHIQSLVDAVIVLLCRGLSQQDDVVMSKHEDCTLYTEMHL